MRYLIFAYSYYYPSGGMEDLYGECETIEEAQLTVDNIDLRSYDEYQIYDSVERCVVKKGAV